MAFKGPTILELLLVLVITPFLSGDSSPRLECPRTIKIERGNNITIACRHDNITLVSSYWYKGDPSRTSPILQIEEGVPGGKEYGSDHYDITKAGAMIITNATIDVEGFYTLLVYFDEENFERNNININVTITPHHICPVIDVCVQCGECEKEVNGTGSLKCSITDSRPKMTLKWVIKSSQNIDTLPSTFEEENDMLTDAWNTSTLIMFNAASCDQHAVLQCVAQDDMDLLIYKYSSIKIYSDNCTKNTTSMEDESHGNKVTFINIPVVLLCVGLTTCFIYYFKRKKNKRNKGSNGLEDLENMNDKKKVATKERMTKEERTVISCLKKIYEPHIFFKGIPFEHPVPPAPLYTGSQYEVTYSSGERVTIASGKLLTSGSFRNENQLVIVGDRGSGKTTFLTQIVNAWVEETNNDLVLIFTSVEGATRDTDLLNLMKRNFPSQHLENITKSLREMIKGKPCLVLLDDLDRLSNKKGAKSAGVDIDDSKLTGSTDAGMAHDDLTVEELLSAQYKSEYKNLKVWITTRDERCIETLGLDGYCKVVLRGFSDKQVQNYIRKTYSYLVHSEKPKEFKACCANGESHDSTSRLAQDFNSLSHNSFILGEEKLNLLRTSPNDTEDSAFEDSEDNICENVYTFLQEYDIVESVRRKPIFLFLISKAYINTCHNVTPPPKKTTDRNVASITEYLVSGLMSKVIEENNKVRFLTFLEETALQLTCGNTTFNKNTGLAETQDQGLEEVVKKAIDVGILQEKQFHSSVDNVYNKIPYSSNCDITFCCQYLQDYFVACAVAKDPNIIRHFTDKVGQCKEEDLSRLVKFLCKEKPALEKCCDFCFQNSWFNVVIDCLFEAREDQYMERIMKKISGKQICISSLQSQYHQNAVIYFFQQCKEKNVTLNSVSIQGEFVTSCLREICFSSVKKIKFVQTTITAEDFLHILQQMAENHDKKELSFLSCHLKDLSDLRDQIKHKEVRDLSVSKMQNEHDVVYEQFDFDTWNWKTRERMNIFSQIIDTH